MISRHSRRVNGKFTATFNHPGGNNHFEIKFVQAEMQALLDAQNSGSDDTPDTAPENDPFPNEDTSSPTTDQSAETLPDKVEFRLTSSDTQDGVSYYIFESDEALPETTGHYSIPLTLSFKGAELGDVPPSTGFYYSVDAGETWRNDFTSFEEVNGKFVATFNHPGGNNHYGIKFVQPEMQALLDAQNNGSDNTSDTAPENEENSDPIAPFADDIEFVVDRHGVEAGNLMAELQFNAHAHAVEAGQLAVIRVPEAYRDDLTGKIEVYQYQTLLGGDSLTLNDANDWTVSVPLQASNSTVLDLKLEIKDDTIFEGDESVAIEMKIDGLTQWETSNLIKIRDNDTAPENNELPNVSTPVHGEQPTENTNTGAN